MSIKQIFRSWVEKSADLLAEEPHLKVLPLMAFVCGVICYFSLPFEPNFYALCGLILCCIGFCFLSFFRFRKILFSLTVLFFCIGIFISFIHAQKITTQFIPHSALNVQVSGIITAVRSRLDRTIIDLEPLDIYFRDKKTGSHHAVYDKKDYPAKIRITIYRDNLTLKQGDKLTGTVFKLTQPAVSVTPYGIGQNITAWFEGIGAIGTMRSFYIEKNKAPQNTYSGFSFLEPFRNRIHRIFQENFQSENAGIAEALVLGGTNFVTESTRGLYRVLGLSHILSVSGFHIGLVMVFVFALVRLVFCLFPDVFRVIFVKRLAVFISLTVGGLYVLLSGSHAPAVRAFLMTAFIFGAILFDRRALSVRNVFMAGIIMLCFMPYLILTASFQLSFIAILCLVGVWDAVQNKLNKLKNKSFLNRFMFALSGFLMLNLLITITMLPFVSYHFHQIQVYGILGNLLFGFLFAFAIIPLLFGGVLLIETPLAPLLLKGADELLSFIRFAGMPVTDWPYATLILPYFHTYGLILWSIGLMGLALFKTKLRFLFLGVMLLIIPSFWGVEKPVALIGGGGNYIGYYDKNNYFVTESYYYPRWHSAFLLFNRETPISVVPKRLKREKLRVGSFELNQMPSACKKATLNIRRKKMQNCPHSISVEDMLDLHTILVFQEEKGTKLYIAGYADKNRPWHINAPMLPIDENQIQIIP